MVMPECQKFAGTEVNRHSGETLALNVPADTYLGNKLHAEIQNFQYIWATSCMPWSSIQYSFHPTCTGTYKIPNEKWHHFAEQVSADMLFYCTNTLSTWKDNAESEYHDIQAYCLVMHDAIARLHSTMQFTAHYWQANIQFTATIRRPKATAMHDARAGAHCTLLTD
jgi:hypothetical protein